MGFRPSHSFCVKNGLSSVVLMLEGGPFLSKFGDFRLIYLMLLGLVGCLCFAFLILLVRDISKSGKH